MTTAVDKPKTEIEVLLKSDAFGQTTEEEAAWLRRPENVSRVLRVLRVLFSQIDSQCNVAELKLRSGQKVDPDWHHKVQNLQIRLRPRLTEFEELFQQYVVEAPLLAAIIRHRQALEAQGGEAAPWDLELWSHAG